MTADPWEAAAARVRASAEQPKPEEAAEALKAVPEADGLRVGRLLVKAVSDVEAVAPRSYIVKGLFYAGEFSTIYGPPACGKSFLAAHIGYRVACGLPVFGQRTRQARVLYCFLEGEGGAGKRLLALRDKYGDSADFCYVAQPINLHDDPQALLELIAAAKAIGAQFIVIDTLNRAMGGGDENSPEGIGKMLSAFSSLRHATGAHVCVVHHSGKDVGKGMRGHSSLHGACDAELEVSRPEVGPRVARVAKAKDDKDGERWGFDLAVVEMGEDEDGDRVTTCLVAEVEGGLAKPGPKIAPQARMAWSAFNDCVASEGRPLPANQHIPPGVTGVTIEQWRANSYARVFLEDDPAAKRQAFNRTLKSLISSSHIGRWGDWLWPARQGNE